jgi:hypothetical protein
MSELEMSNRYLPFSFLPTSSLRVSLLPRFFNYFRSFRLTEGHTLHYPARGRELQTIPIAFPDSNVLRTQGVCEGCAGFVGLQSSSARSDYLPWFSLVPSTWQVSYSPYWKRNDRKCCYVGLEVVTPVVMKNTTIFWDITPCSPLEVKRSLVVSCFHSGFFFGLFLDPKNGGNILLRNVG